MRSVRASSFMMMRPARLTSRCLASACVAAAAHQFDGRVRRGLDLMKTIETGCRGGNRYACGRYNGRYTQNFQHYVSVCGEWLPTRNGRLAEEKLWHQKEEARPSNRHGKWSRREEARRSDAAASLLQYTARSQWVELTRSRSAPARDRRSGQPAPPNRPTNAANPGGTACLRPRSTHGARGDFPRRRATSPVSRA